ncbi:type II secretion system ATPase GspE [Sporohalobacter salinus]|uniref:type II secretion system ATPase GspE n=1 Tax=Sporohalobacter salinus TaxID=1494606 RepID=UPI001961F87A|nr:type II secretion system ATPase GspE [Sporohalobacter salinus]MBM7623781.1 type II secretion system protein E [Sporohalobacter salinus]
MTDYEIDTELLNDFSREFLREHCLLPIEQTEKEIQFITSESLSLSVTDDLRTYCNRKIKIKLLDDELISELINEYLGAPVDTVEGMMDDLNSFELDQYSDFELDNNVEDLEDLAQEAPIIRLVNVIITNGLKQGASDIHIEPFEDDIRIRYRIDGVLYETESPPKNVLPAIITRIKIMADLDIAERRLAQEGRIRIKVLGRQLDIRVSITPTLEGESAVLRLLDRAEVLLNLDNLGFDEQILDRYLTAVEQPNGILLVTGPTGSGKTTTLYATLNYLRSTDKKIITIEDPVEYQLDGINQIQVKPEIDFTFAEGLRSILRQDPDIIMVGEIRDLETAEIAIQAALTGHLVLATLHTNDAAGAINRLLDMGVENYLLASTLNGVLAQRLVRRLCSECKESYQPDESQLEILNKQVDDLDQAYQVVGCEECNDIGFAGRIGIYELITADQDIKSAISGGQRVEDIRKLARNKGMDSLFASGWEKLKSGITTIDEIIRVTRNNDRGS